MMTPRHAYDEELKKLNAEIVHMSDVAKVMVKKGMQAFLEGNDRTRQEVVALDKEMFTLEMVAERHCVEIILLNQPVATDLRALSASLRIITDVNRIGRYGRDIAELCTVPGQGAISHPFPLPLMAERTLALVTDAIASFVNGDEATARQLFVRDDEVDGLWDTIFRGSLTYMLEDPRNITMGTSVMLAARYLERIADHACNIGERVVFMVKGERLDHYAPKKSPQLCWPSEPEGKVTSADGYYSTPLDEK